jgi:putative transposase
MISNRKLSRAVSDQGFGEARRMLGYMTEREGGTLVTADRWYPSSKTCSGCGSVKAKLTLADRVYVRRMRPCHGQGRERRTQLAIAGRQWGGQGKRLRRDRKTAPSAARPGETGTRHRERGQDRDRLPATAGCAMNWSLLITHPQRLKSLPQNSVNQRPTMALP